MAASSSCQQKPWIELYRPFSLDELLLHRTMRQLLQGLIDAKMMRNIVISGPPGVGKTSTVQCLARQILGARYNDCVIELNSSNDRGIQPIMALSDFCKKSVTSIDPDTKKVINLQKIILFDEADRMPEKSQRAIEALMTEFPNVAFAFTCNDSSLIIGAIQSNCTILRYMPIPKDAMIERLTAICTTHKAKFTKDGINKAVLYSKGDMRRAINIAQSTWSGFGIVSQDSIQKLYPLPSFDKVRHIIELCRKGGKLNEALREVRNMQQHGASMQDILCVAETLLITNEDIDIKFRIMALEKLGECMLAMSTFQSQLQFETFFAKICAAKLL